MTRTSKVLKRLGIAGLAAVTIGAGVPALISTPAQAAGPVTAVTFTSSPTPTAPAGTCINYTLHAVDAAGPAAGATLTVRIVGDAQATQDVSFCNAAQNGFGDGNPAQPAPSAPNVLSAQGPQAGGGSTDVARFSTNGAGDVTFGVSGIVGPGSATITTGVDSNGNGTFDAGELNGPNGSATFTAGGPAGSNANQDAAQTITIDRTSDTAVAGQARSFTLTVVNDGAAPTNANRQAGVTPSFEVEQPAGAPGPIVQGPTNCPATNNKGVSVCSVTINTAGLYTIRFFVNQTVASGGTTPAWDGAGEPSVVVNPANVQAAPTGTYTVTATCKTVLFAQLQTTDTTNNTCTNEERDTARTIKFNVDNTATGGASTATLSLTFAVTGGSGDETVNTGGSPANECQTALDGSTASTTDSFCNVTVTDPTPISGEVLTVTGTVTGTSQKGSATVKYVNQPADARNLTLAPKTATTTPGQVRTFTATVVDSDGKGVAGVVVNWTESGPGAFRNGGSSSQSTTDANGEATADVTSLSNESGAQTITATIGTGGTQCGNGANVGNDPRAGTPPFSSTNPKAAGDCDDTAVNTFGTPSPSATPSPTSSAGGKGTLSTSTPDIQPNIQGVLNASGLTGSAVYELMCYSRPSTTYFIARTATVSTGGSTLEFRILPGTNTRCYVRPQGNDSLASNSVVINVHTTLSLSAVGNGQPHTYIFQGRNLPRRSGQLITLYRIAGGQEIRTSNLVTDASGIYRVTRTFTGRGTFQFRVRTSQTLTNAPGASNIITVTIR